MAFPRDILSRWRCRRWAARLVDFADGALEARACAQLNRHLATCPRCHEALTALQSVPNVLRDHAPLMRDDQFWQQQRHRILRAIHTPPVLPARRFLRPTAAWRAGVVAVATGVVAVAGYRLLQQRHTLPMSPSTRTSALDIDDVETEAIAALSDMVKVLVPQSEFMAAGGDADDTIAEDVAQGGWLDDSTMPEIAVNDLNDDELDRLDDLVGNAPS